MIAPHPPNGGFERRKRAEFDPHDFAQARLLDELGPAAAFRKIVNFDDEVDLSAAAKLNLGVYWSTRRRPRFRMLFDLVRI